MLAKVNRIFRTVVRLKATQIFHQIYYRLRSKFVHPQQFGHLKGYNGQQDPLQLLNFPFTGSASSLSLDVKELRFVFINLEQTFAEGQIDWNYEGHGKLWNYNLNYFEFLFDKQIVPEQGLALIQQYCSSWNNLKGGLEPYPTSLRLINWVKFLSIYEIRDEAIDGFIYRQYMVLCRNLEYHLLANHVLENAFSLLFGAYYLRSEELYKRAVNLINRQLTEQVMGDGAHFERSPMYHHTILFRLLDGINLVKHNHWKTNDLLDFLESTAGRMLGWMKNMTFGECQMAMVKDAAPGIAPHAGELLSYAEKLSIEMSQDYVPLGDSGYRRLRAKNMELLIDVGSISPSYQPGHAQADELNFLVFNQGKPFIVDTGTSTYEKNSRRQFERSTQAHNCIYVAGTDSSEVWGGFRVGRRAKVKVQKESSKCIEVSHNGYNFLGLSVYRSFKVHKNSLTITGRIEGKESQTAGHYIHFHPDVSVTLGDKCAFAENVYLSFEGFEDFSVETYMFALGFNKLVEAQRIVLLSRSEVTITLKYAN